MKKELLSPAGDFDCLKGAVSAGADAVYLGGSRLNARESAKNFNDEELMEAVTYCHLRGVKVYITLNTVVSDREIASLEEYIKYLAEINIDGVILQSLGLASYVRCVAPSLEIHASTQLTVHSLDGVLQMHKLGFSRAVLSRELSAENVKYICENSPIEIETFVHGALCMCYSGQCYFSSVIGQRSGNRGRCAQPCRQPYKNGYELSLKDLSVADMFKEYLSLGVTSFKIEGRLKDPQYVFGVTSIYRKLIDENRNATKEEVAYLAALFSRQGFTKAYLEGKPSKNMFGIRTQENKNQTAALEKFILTEKDIPVSAEYQIDKNSIKITFNCKENSYLAEDNDVQPALTRGTTKEDVEKQLRKTGGTGFVVTDVTGNIEENLFIPVSKLNELRRLAIDGLKEALCGQKSIATGKCEIKTENKIFSKPVFNFHFNNLQQYNETKAIHNLAENIFLPLIYVKNVDNQAFSLPRIITDSEKPFIAELLKIAKDKGVKKILCNTTDQIYLVREMGFEPVGNFTLNIFNSYDLNVFKELGVNNGTLSCELSLSKIKDIDKCINTNIVVYGRLPLMVTENCIIKNAGKCINFKGYYSITDKTGHTFPVICHHPHRNIILNSNPVYVADKLYEISKYNVYGYDFHFTVEKGKEIIDIVNRYLREEKANFPFTRGLLFKNVL